MLIAILVSLILGRAALAKAPSGEAAGETED